MPWSSAREPTLDTSSSTHFLKINLLHLEIQKKHLMELYCIYMDSPGCWKSSFTSESLFVGAESRVVAVSNLVSGL